MPTWQREQKNTLAPFPFHKRGKPRKKVEVEVGKMANKSLLIFQQSEREEAGGNWNRIGQEDLPLIR